jgi:amidase
MMMNAAEIAAKVAEGELRAEDVLTDHLARIQEANPDINAIVTLAPDLAMSQARDIDRRVAGGEAVGALAGVPVGIKDIIETAGIRTTYASPLFKDNVPSQDALTVQRIKVADGVIVGKTNTPEFATGGNTNNALFGPTRNPWNTDLTPGGSTGGGAAGLAAGMFALALGTDLGGSLRLPAAFCGVVGIRQTPGLVPFAPNPTPFDLFEVQGPMARTAQDVALALSVLAAPDAGFPVGSHGSPEFDAEDAPRRIGYVEDIAGVGIETDIAAACRTAAAALGRHDIGEPALDLSEGRDAFTTLRGQWMVNKHLANLDRLDEMGDNLAGNIRSGLAQSPTDIAKAEATRAKLWQVMAAYFSEFDLLLTPVTAVSPFPWQQNYPETINGAPMQTYIDWIAPTFVISLLGLPALSVPAGLNQDGMPVGLQIIGPRYSEAAMLAVAAEIQKAFPTQYPQ